MTISVCIRNSQGGVGEERMSGADLLSALSCCPNGFHLLKLSI